jgi:hypothetical protein
LSWSFLKLRLRVDARGYVAARGGDLTAGLHDRLAAGLPPTRNFFEDFLQNL